MAKMKTSKKRYLVSKKSFSCYNCNYTAHSKCRLIRHLRVHANRKNVYRSTYNRSLNTCVQCHAIFKSERLLDDHVLEKHPEFMTSITSKLYECTECIYKTAERSNFDKHMLTHAETASIYKCIHCNASYKQKRSLDGHIIKNHPDFITSTSSRVYKCTECIYKTTRSDIFNQHISKHSGTASSHKLKKCIHCNASFKQKITLDQHVIKKHPDFIASITCKLFECTQCSYRTVKKHYFDEHMSRHFGGAPSCKPSTCIYCNVTFKSKKTLDDHVVKKHPNFATTVSSKLYQCTKCIYKTTRKHHFDRHMSVHPKTTPHNELSTCIHCDKTLNATGLDEHVVRQHPNFIDSVTSTIYECSKCSFKTTIKNNFDRHSSAHPVH